MPDLADVLPELRREFGVPGCAVGLLTPDGVVDAADGVLHRGTGAPASTDSLFQVGSVTKLWTATLVLQCVEDGLVGLDDPVASVLPGFRVHDEAATRTITVRHLLTHTGGTFGDAFTATTRGDDAVARFVTDVVPGLTQTVPPGTGFSYDIAGYVVLGRIAEVLRGEPFHEVLASRIAAPLELRRWAATPEQALLHATALGHLGTGEPAPVWSLPAANGPSGSMLALTPRSLLAFAHDVLSGHTLLSPGTTAQALSPQVDVPDIGYLGSHWGLGWTIFDWAGTRVVGHDGATIGQSARFRVLPDHGVALVSMTNGGETAGFHRAVTRHLLPEVTEPPAPVPPSAPAPVDAVRYGGRYASDALSVVVAVRPDGTARVVQSLLVPEAQAIQPEDDVLEMVLLDDGRLIELGGRHVIAAFVGGGPGEPATHVFWAGRLTPRVDHR